MTKNKYEIIKELIEVNIDDLKEFTKPVNDGYTFFEKDDYNLIEGLP